METNKNEVAADVGGLTEIAGVNIERLMRNLDDTSYNEGSEALACRLSDCREVIKALLATKAASAEPEQLETLVIERRIAITPEYEGGFVAEQFGDEEAPSAKGYGATPSEAIAAMKPIAPAAPEQAVPEGWKIVPIKPNSSMLEAAAKADDEGFEAGRSHGASGREIYDAMLAAAPVPPVPAPAELTTEVERLKAAKANLIQRARMWCYEARAQRATLLGILRRFGLPEHDWEAKRLIVHHVQRLTQSSVPAPQTSTPVPRVGGNTSIEALCAEAEKLASILRGLCEGGGEERSIDIYADSYQPGDGDVFVTRAAAVLIDLAHVARQDQAAAVPEDDDVAEGLQILNDLIANVEQHGNYSKEATLTFLGQIKQCLTYPAAAPVAQAERAAVPSGMNDDQINFIDSVIEVAFEGGDLDGGTIQEWAEKAGLLEARTMTEPCSEGQNCRCADDNDFPLTCYQKTYRRPTVAQEVEPGSVQAAVQRAVEQAADIMWNWAGLSDPEQQRKCRARILSIAAPSSTEDSAQAAPVLDESVLLKLARRTLWIAYVWNDHNFEAAHEVARETCEAVGIKSFDDANRYLESLPAAQAAPAEQRDVWAKWIVQRGRGLPDHACVECAPHSEILKQGFQCTYHQALALRSTSTAAQAATDQAKG